MKVVLVDREGTLIVDPDFDRVDSPEKVQLLPDTLKALTLLANNGYGIAIITNQTNIAQGRLTTEGFWQLHQKVLDLLEPSGIKVVKTYVCPHNASDDCTCRKPKPALLLEALEDFKLNPTGTFMIGDRDTDIEAGTNAGTRTILVKTGKHPIRTDSADFTADNLFDAARFIVDSEAKA